MKAQDKMDKEEEGYKEQIMKKNNQNILNIDNKYKEQ